MTLVNILFQIWKLLKIKPVTCFTFYPPASEASEQSKLAQQARRYKFHPIHSLPPICKKKKKKFPYGWGLAQKCMSVVCCLCVCHEFVPNYLLNCWFDWHEIFFTKIRENVYLRILILKFRGQHPRVKALGQILVPNQL